MAQVPIPTNGPVLPKGHKIHCRQCNALIGKLARDVFRGDEIAEDLIVRPAYPIASNQPLSCFICYAGFAHRFVSVGLKVRTH